MSLSAFKEALKPCSKSSLSSSFVSDSQINSTISTRKPLKSSLSKQLLRLREFPDSQPQSQFVNLARDTDLKSETENGDERKEKKKSEVEDSKLESSFRHVDTTGPYEPLLLSSRGEIPVVEVPASINSRLLEHQREGIQFLYNLYKNNHGGILGDDMGLGKTIQTIALLAAVYGKGSELDSGKQPEKGPVLIIGPSSVILNWEEEFSRWSTFRVAIYHGPNRDLILDKLTNHGVEVIITSFDTYRMQQSSLSNIQWEVVIVDEAHRLKNEKSKLYIECMKINTLKRYGLTGTVMQNKIMELFNLFDWVVPGGLGTREHFREFYDEPLKLGQRLSAPKKFVKVAEERKQHLASVLQKYMLRRTKDETIGHLMKGKEDNIVFCSMSEMQKQVYRRTLQLPDIQCLINKDLPCSCGSPLKQSECCRRTVPDGVIWPHLHVDNPEGCESCPYCIVLPCLIKLQQISNHLELVKPNRRDDPDKQRRDAEFVASVFGVDVGLEGGSAQNESFMRLSDVQHCGKMRTLERLMRSWISKGDKVLLFSHSVRMLDILEKFVIRKGYSFLRLDGSTPTGIRLSLVQEFSSSPSKQVFLISTRAGGLGINLSAANRVVVFDPNWNPAHDLQAQDRSFRFGQKRHVTVFRLLAAGSLEELVYTRQIYKQQLSNIAVAGKMEKRYSKECSDVLMKDCKEFQGELFGICNLFRDLSDKLFTSEIIESHGNQDDNDSQRPGFSEDCVISKSMESGTAQKHSSTSLSTQPAEKRTRIDPQLQDLGVVYVHRNEDVVNFRSQIDHGTKISHNYFLMKQAEQPQSVAEEGRIQSHDNTVEEPQSIAEEERIESHERAVEEPQPLAEERTEPNGNSVDEVMEDSVVSELPKKIESDHFGILSALMGIGEDELNKLLLSVPPP